MKNFIPESGFLRLPQLIGQSEVTTEQAAKNRALGKGPRSPRPTIPAIFPWSKSKLWDAVKKGEFPKPVKLGPRITVWDVREIRAHYEKIARPISASEAALTAPATAGKKRQEESTCQQNSVQM